MYTVPRGFMKTLTSLDRRLGCRFNSDLERFVVTYSRPFGEPLSLFLVETKDGEFRWPSDVDILFLRQWDMENMSLNDRLTMVTKHMEDTREKTRRDGRDNIRNMTKDDRIQLMNSFGKLMGNGKFNSAFRRIIPKSRGQAYNVVDKRFHSAAS